jgi:hypothetical protein
MVVVGFGAGGRNFVVLEKWQNPVFGAENGGGREFFEKSSKNQKKIGNRYQQLGGQERLYI